MKKVFLIALVAVATLAFVVSCEKDSVDENVELFGPDPQTPPPGSGNN